MSVKSLAALAVPASLVFAVPATAQYMPHLDPNLYMLTVMQMNTGPNTCMTGIAPPEKELAEARDPAPGVMQAYFKAAQAGEARSHLFRSSKKAEWSGGGTTVAATAVDAQTDPLAVAGNTLDPEPLRFFRSGNFQTAHGQWGVLDSNGMMAGVYDAQFQREKGEWKLLNLKVMGKADSVEPAMQYCVTPGDVTENKITSAGNSMTYWEKELTKSEAKLLKEKDRLAKAEAALAAKPGSKSAIEAVRRNKLLVERREEKITEAREGLENAQEYKTNSERDVAEIAAMTVPASQALAFRTFELTTDKEAAEKKAKEEAEKKAEKAASE